MFAPKKEITQNVQDELGGTDQRSSSWVMAIVRYLEPSSMADSNNFPTRINIIQNDIVGVSITNSKKSFGKMCNVSLKCTDIWYPSTVTPGDWIVIWMHKTQAETDRITDVLNKVQNGATKVGNALCDAKSGLKFMGRCLGVTHSDIADPGGQRVINQNISAQSFLEFSSSVYYTAVTKSHLKLPTSPGTGDVSSETDARYDAAKEAVLQSGLSKALADLAIKYRDFYVKGDGEFTPDVIISLYFILIMGIDKDNYTKSVGVNGIFNNGIHVPKYIGIMLNRRFAKKIWQIMNVYLGVQKYKNRKGNWWESFMPVVSVVDEDVFRKLPTRCQGFVPFAPPLWDNVSMWDIFNNYLNPVVNEMYTSMRINASGRIVPTLTIREKPFSTGLFNSLKESTFGSGGTSGDVEIEKPSNTDVAELLDQFEQEKAGASKNQSLTTDKKVTSKDKFTQRFNKSGLVRTMFANLPRWVISETVVKSFTFSSSESARINFVQV